MIHDQLEQISFVDAVKRGRFDGFRSCCASTHLPSSAFQENADGSYYYSAGVNFCCFNGVVQDIDRPLTEDDVNRAVAYFKSLNMPFIWWSSSEVLAEQGFTYGGIFKGIALTIPEHIPQSSNHRIKLAKTPAELDAFAEIALAGSGIGENIYAQYRALLDATEAQGDQHHFLAYVDHQPVGTLTLITGATAGIWNLSTLTSYRKQGVGSALVSAALREASRLQYQQVMAILAVEGLAQGLFANQGFTEVCQFPFYVHNG